ncbi:prenyltransferase [Streptomyces sp. Ru71]|nr:prenyltransferase [Streptomyces sp. Ru71]
MPAPAGGYRHEKERPGTLGERTAGQLRRLAAVVGLDPDDADAYADALLTLLGPVAQRPLDLPPPSATFLSDDHTPVEFSLSFTPGAAPVLRVLLDPGCGAGSLARAGRVGLEAVRAMARRWNFGTDRLEELADLFLPSTVEGPLALWCALELRPGGTPQVKVYLNPAAGGPEAAAATVREALHRLGHGKAYDALPSADRPLFFALDLGDWAEPRVKVYLAHHGLTAAEAGGLSRMAPGPAPAEIEEFFTLAGGMDARLDRRPGQSCHAFTETATGLPSGFTLYVPVREHVAHDGEALERARTLLTRYGIDPAPLARSLSAVTTRRLTDGVGLVAYLALAHQHGRPPRVTVYVSSECYRIRPPAAVPVTETVG